MAKTDTLGSENNPNQIEKFLKFNEEKVSVFTTDKVKAHYPQIGTEVKLHPSKAEKWIKSGWATAEPVEGDDAEQENKDQKRSKAKA